MRLVFFLLLISSTLIRGQETDIKFQNWLDFNGSYTLNEKWKTYTDAGYRIMFISEKIHRFFIRPSASFKINNFLLLQGGLGLFTTFNHKSRLWEFRLFQGIKIRWPVIFSIPLNHYFRFEERFFSGTFNTIIFRARYRIGSSIQYSQSFYSPLQLEWFVSYGKDIDFQLNEFRGVIGFGYIINDYWKVELNTISQNTSASTDLFSFNDLIIRLRVYKEFNTD